MKVLIKKIERIFNDFFKIDRAVIQFERFDGTITKDVIRYNFDRGDSVAMLAINPRKQSIILLKQFRYPAYASDPSQGWLLEIPAGSVEKGDNPLDTAKRELIEEIGYTCENLNLIYTLYPSPGGSSERIFLYYIGIDDHLKISEGGGLKEEEEDIQVIEIPIAEAFQLLDNKDIYDAKTIIALQWLRNRMQ